MLKLEVIGEKSLEESWFEMLKEQLRQDAGRNYFLLLGVRSLYKTYEKLWYNLEEGVLLASRRSGNAQLFISQTKVQSPQTMETLEHLLYELPYKELITTKAYAKSLPSTDRLGERRPRSFIAKLALDTLKGVKPACELSKIKFKELPIEYIPQIMGLNHEVFAHSASEALLIERLDKGYGRAFGLINEDGVLLSTLQTECEEQNMANIVGVATDPQYQGHGLASLLVYLVCEILKGEGKVPHLMFDNLKAGQIYQKLGFEIYDQTVHFCKPLPESNFKDR